MLQRVSRRRPKTPRIPCRVVALASVVYPPSSSSSLPSFLLSDSSWESFSSSGASCGSVTDWDSCDSQCSEEIGGLVESDLLATFSSLFSSTRDLLPCAPGSDIPSNSVGISWWAKLSFSESFCSVQWSANIVDVSELGSNSLDGAESSTSFKLSWKPSIRIASLPSEMLRQWRQSSLLKSPSTSFSCFSLSLSFPSATLLTDDSSMSSFAWDNSSLATSLTDSLFSSLTESTEVPVIVSSPSS